MSMLEFKAAGAGYPGKQVLSDISFTVEEGDFFGIIGPNGAGKTTLFRAVTGVVPLTSGSINFENKDIMAVPRLELARNVATMIQVYDMPFSYSAREFVMMGRFPHQKRFENPNREDENIVEESMRITDTLAFAERKLNELSGGERQRLVLAQSLAQKPKLLLLDEPTAYLDIGHQIAILDLIRKLNKETGLTVLTVLHDLNLAAEYCGKLLMLDGGRIHACGSPAEVLTFGSIEKVFKTVVVVKENPFSSKPYVVLVPGERAGSARGREER